MRQALRPHPCPHSSSRLPPLPPADTNYPQWVPYIKADANMRFRFVLQIEQLASAQQAAAQQAAARDPVGQESDAASAAVA